MWKKFNYGDFKEGLFWLSQIRTGETKFGSVLAWVEKEVDGEPRFTAVDPVNHGKIEDNGVITHFTEVVCPADVEKVNPAENFKSALNEAISAGLLRPEDNTEAFKMLSELIGFGPLHFRSDGPGVSYEFRQTSSAFNASGGGQSENMSSSGKK